MSPLILLVLSHFGLQMAAKRKNKITTQQCVYATILLILAFSLIPGENHLLR